MKAELVLGLILGSIVAQSDPLQSEQLDQVQEAPLIEYGEELNDAFLKANRPPLQKTDRNPPLADRAHGRRPVQQVRRLNPQQQRAAPGHHDRALRAAGGRNPRPQRGPIQKRPILREEVVESVSEEEGSGSFFVPFPYYLPASRIIVESGQRKQELTDESLDDQAELGQDWFVPKEENKQAAKKIVLARSPHLDMKR